MEKFMIKPNNSVLVDCTKIEYINYDNDSLKLPTVIVLMNRCNVVSGCTLGTDKSFFMNRINCFAKQHIKCTKILSYLRTQRFIVSYSKHRYSTFVDTFLLLL